MNRFTRSLAYASLGAGVIAVAAAAHNPADNNGLRRGAAEVQALGAMAFSPEGILFVADNRASTLYAFDLGDNTSASYGERSLSRDIDRKVAALLGTTAERVRFNDMAVHPKTHAVYLSVSRMDGNTAQPALVRVRGEDQVELIDLAQAKSASTAIPGVPSRDKNTPWGQPQWMLSVTDLAFADGNLYVAGLSNEQFASSLRKVAFPFEKGGSLTTVEIYHTSHDKWETAAPIEAFLPVTIGGQPMILAGYGCSPIATFSRSEIGTEKHLRGKTVAELGGGNRPLDIVSYTKNGKEWILVANSHRTLMRLDPAEIAKAPAMTTPMSQAYEAGGVGYLSVSSAGVMHIHDLDENAIAVLERDTQSGSLNLNRLQKRWL